VGFEVSEISVKWHLIPDGITSVVKLTIEGEFRVHTETASAEAEEGLAQLISRISTHDVALVREKLTAARWFGDGWDRPDEPRGR